MLEFIRKLFGCQCCKILQKQIVIVNEEKRELLNTILDLVKPVKPEVPIIMGNQSQIVRPPSARWDVRLREKERQARNVQSTSEILKVGHPEIKDEISKLEKELEIDDAGENQERKTV